MQGENVDLKQRLSVFVDFIFFANVCVLTKTFSFYITGIDENIFDVIFNDISNTATWIAVLTSPIFIVFAITAGVYTLLINERPGASLLKHSIPILSSPICTSTLHFSIFLIGIYFSIISSAIHLWVTTKSVLTYRESFSYSIAILCIAMVVFILNQLAINKKNSNQQERQTSSYNDKILKLQDLIRLAPANGFANTLAEYVDVADDFVQMVVQNRSKANIALNYLRTEAPTKLDFKFDAVKGITGLSTELNRTKVTKEADAIKEHIKTLKEQSSNNEKYIRALLAAYARLAALFDGIEPSKPHNNIYRANLMLKYSSVDRTVPDLEQFRYVPAVLKEEVLGGGERLKAGALTNYLTLHKELSVSIYTVKKSITKKINRDSEGKGRESEYEPVAFEPDSDIKEFSTPYFTMPAQKKYNCFGAPKAIADADCQFINDTILEIDSWKRDSSPPDELLEEARKHFSSHNRARSVISLPLMTSRYSEEHKKNVMGVVNIYRDKTDIMMGTRSKQKEFGHITTPLNYALARIVSQDILARYYANFLQAILESANIDPS
ncbi:hypothetical protein [Shewanella colwelliana]|uniref:hypothetical protein n=1 Tax=Shewanella colwelliana TaxID=23 RepID=UPI0022AE6422|nr:hypothetical protein [Shewanella colwelliana]MCZ4338180.1 hypothetical protein [Shewanella colwelliana]